jgi:hypothetical protein
MGGRPPCHSQSKIQRSLSQPVASLRIRAHPHRIVRRSTVVSVSLARLHTGLNNQS